MDEERWQQMERRLAELVAENAALRAENERLRRELDEWKRGFRERRKRRSSKAEAASSPRERKKPGCKPGHPGVRREAPNQVDHHVEHALPSVCSCCGGEVQATEATAESLVLDVPPVRPETTRHTTPVGRCTQCNKRVVAKLPGAPSNGVSVAPVTLGPNVQAMAMSLRFEAHVPLGKIGAFLGTWLGVPLGASGVAQMLGRVYDRSQGCFEELERIVREANVVGIDETGMRQDGLRGWMWLARTAKVSLFRAELSRGAWVAEAMLGQGFVGVVVSDFYAAYTAQTGWQHAYCGAHLERDAKKLAEVNPCRETREFRLRLRGVYEAGAEAQQRGQPADVHGVRIRLGHLARSPNFVGCLDVVALQERLVTHRKGILLFATRADVPATNNATERDLRDYARHRAMTGGTRSRRGSKVLAHGMSITQTRRKNALPLGPWVHSVWDAHLAGRPPPSLLGV